MEIGPVERHLFPPDAKQTCSLNVSFGRIIMNRQAVHAMCQTDSCLKRNKLFNSISEAVL